MIFPSNRQYLTNADFPHFEGKNITFGITGDCNLRCTYCYIHEKRQDREMRFETAKQIVDRMFEEPYAYLDDNFSEKNTKLEKTDPNRDITKKVIFDFIGGEPFIRVALIDRICDYIKYKAASDPHRYLFRFSFSTNGVTFLDNDVQDYLKKNKELVSVGITIDGTRDMHDACRIFPDGSGSYDQVVNSIALWQDQYNGLSTKVTIAPENLSGISNALFHLWQDLGIQHVPANVVFEPVWQPEHEAVFEEELIKIKDFLLRDQNYTRYCTTLFDETIGAPIDPEDIRNSCGGDGKMLFWDHAGTFYNCIRFAPVSCLDGKGYPLGNLENGYNMENYNRLKSMTRRSCSDDECFNCEVASGCSYCPGQQYDEHGDFNIRSKSICGMHKVRVKVSRQYFQELKQHLSGEEPEFPEVIYMDEPKEVLERLVDTIYEKNQIFTTLRELDGSGYTDLDTDTLTERYVELSKEIDTKIDALRDKYLPDQKTRCFADFLRGYFVERNAQTRKAVRETYHV